MHILSGTVDGTGNYHAAWSYKLSQATFDGGTEQLVYVIARMWTVWSLGAGVGNGRSTWAAWAGSIYRVYFNQSVQRPQDRQEASHVFYRLTWYRAAVIDSEYHRNICQAGRLASRVRGGGIWATCMRRRFWTGRMAWAVGVRWAR